MPILVTGDVTVNDLLRAFDAIGFHVRIRGNAVVAEPIPQFIRKESHERHQDAR